MRGDRLWFWSLLVLCLVALGLTAVACANTLPPETCEPVRQTADDLTYLAAHVCPHLEVAAELQQGPAPSELARLRRVCAQADSPLRRAAVDTLCPVPK